MELERLKEKRKGLRISFTKHLTKIETTLGREIAAGYTKEAKLDELLSLKSQLTEKLNELIKADESVQLKIEISEMAAEIASSEEYKDKAKIRIPSQFIRNIALGKGIELADNSTSERIHVLIGSDYISEILGERNIRISKRLLAAHSIFGYLLQGKEEEIDGKDISANHLIAENEELDFDRAKDLWLLETIGINSDKEVSMSDKEILKSFEQIRRMQTKDMKLDCCGRRIVRN
ncbi:hypothetical protein AVEN_123813-1 [Araneus ventricosus]|uniref:Peptidase aspartic putative domain-containing protein n=1 Tax=Araneus ventricosus TaxID=182803 RepID=A0A4Y2BM20_ARAVE|nr:hypothetical protein AVEN_123813-1 [Araneus ventricosus]